MDHVLIILLQSSLDEKKAQLVVEEIKAAGGDAIAVGGDVGADDFPQRILDATITYVVSTSSFIHVSLSTSILLFLHSPIARMNAA